MSWNRLSYIIVKQFFFYCLPWTSMFLGYLWFGCILTTPTVINVEYEKSSYYWTITTNIKSIFFSKSGTCAGPKCPHLAKEQGEEKEEAEDAEKPEQQDSLKHNFIKIFWNSCFAFTCWIITKLLLGYSAQPPRFSLLFIFLFTKLHISLVMHLSNNVELMYYKVLNIMFLWRAFTIFYQCIWIQQSS